MNRSSEMIKTQLDNEHLFWYFGKHGKSFVQMCYAVDLLDKMKADSTQKDLDKLRDEFNSIHPTQELQASMFKSMISAKMYGLLDNTSSVYVKCKPTAVFYKIKEVTQGNYENTELYINIIEQQVEKIFCLSQFFDTANKKSMQIYPLFLLYKVLIKVGERTGEYTITWQEFSSFVATAKHYSEWTSVVSDILEYRTLGESEMMQYDAAGKHDQRYHQIIKILPQFDLGASSGKPKNIAIKQEYISKVKAKSVAYEFRNSVKKEQFGALPNGVTNFADYVQFLGNNKSLIPTL